MRLSDRTAMITGAAGPMGEAIARRFLEEGARVLLFDISGRRLDAVAAGLAEPGRVVTHRGDSLVEAEVQAAVTAGLAALGRLDILVNVVGGIVSPRIATPFLEMTDRQFSATLELNLKTVLLAARHVVPHMQRHGYGRIVNLGSISMAGEAGQAEYSAAKAGVAGLTRVMAIEFAPQITVNCIAPALIRTRVLDRLDPAMIEQYRQRTLLRRLGEPADIAAAAAFLASDDAAFITGAILPVSGGLWPAL
jgi:NAD(P)-dependent dehydrogenase (short-subunit alcohol dehydrogenase family)